MTDLYEKGIIDLKRYSQYPLKIVRQKLATWTASLLDNTIEELGLDWKIDRDYIVAVSDEYDRVIDIFSTVTLHQSINVIIRGKNKFIGIKVPVNAEMSEEEFKKGFPILPVELKVIEMYNEEKMNVSKKLEFYEFNFEE